MNRYLTFARIGLKISWRASLVTAMSLWIVCLVGVSGALAYSIDYGLDQARGETTIEFYGDEFQGESLREIVEQTLRNNDNHPDRKETAQNSYKRQSFLNDVLPEKRSTAFSKDTLMKLRKTEHPKERLKQND